MPLNVSYALDNRIYLNSINPIKQVLTTSKWSRIYKIRIDNKFQHSNTSMMEWWIKQFFYNLIPRDYLRSGRLSSIDMSVKLWLTCSNQSKKLERQSISDENLEFVKISINTFTSGWSHNDNLNYLNNS